MKRLKHDKSGILTQRFSGKLSLFFFFVSLMFLCVAFTGTGCSRRSTKSVAVGSKNFTEQLIIGELMAQLVEEHTDITVRRRFNLGGTMICHQALARGDIDVYAEYTGTALTAILKEQVVSDPDQIYLNVKSAYLQNFELVWLDQLGFNNTYTITVRKAFAEQHGLTKISDLKNIADTLTAGFTAEFSVREDGYPGFQTAYGFGFNDTKDMDPSLMYRAIAREDVDVICAFATDGRIAAYNLTALDDDKRFFPPYHAAPVARKQMLVEFPEIKKALSMLAGAIDDTTMQQLNFEVDEKKRSPAEVASEFLTEKGMK